MPQGQYSLTPTASPQSNTSGKYSLATTPTEVVKEVTPQPVVDVGKTIASNIPSLQTTLSTGAGVAAGAATESPFVGSAVMAGVSKLLDPELNKKGFIQNSVDFGKDVLVNELAGRALSSAINVGKEVLNPGSVKFLPNVQKAIDLGLKPTPGQTTGSTILNLIENAFAGNMKNASLVRSGALTEDQANLLVQSLSKRKDFTTGKPFDQAVNLQKNLDDSFNKSLVESNTRGNATQLISNANLVTQPVYSQVPSTIMPGTVITQQTGTRNVKGPISPNNLIQTAETLLDKLNRSKVPPDPNSPLFNTLNNIIKEGHELDANGQSKIKDWDFGDAWETKKTLYNIAYGKSAYSQPNFQDSSFAQLAKSLDKDIETSLPKWAINGSDAAKFFGEAKQIVADRINTFTPLQKFINSESGTVGALDSIIQDPKLIKQAVLSGKLQIPDGNGYTYISNNTRKDLASYEITQIFNRAKQIDKSGNSTFDGTKLVSQILDPNKQEAYRILFGSAKNPESIRSNLESVLKAAALVSPNGATGLGRFGLLRLTGAGLNLGTSLLEGLGASAYSTDVIGGTVGLNTIGKLLTNPSTTRLITAALAGGPMNMPSAIAGRVISNVLKNEPMTLEYKNGNKLDGKIGNDGQFTIPIGTGDIKK